MKFMTWLKQITRRIRALFGQQKLDADMAEEMRAHLERRTQANLAAGMPPEEARYAAQRQFGGVDQLKEIAREQRGTVWVEQFFQDLRFSLRIIAARRWFSFAIVVTLALGIGINTTVFTLVNAVLFKPVPVPGGERLVVVGSQGLTKAAGADNLGVSYPDFRELRAENRAFEGLEAVSYGEAVVGEQGNPPERFRMARTSSGLFGMLHTPVTLGRGFSPADDQVGAEAVVLIGHGVWQRRYGGAADVVGRVVRVNGAAATVVGVMPAGFKFPQNEELWMPLVPTAEMEKRSARGLEIFGIIRPDISIATARDELSVIAARLAAKFPETNKDIGTTVLTFHERYNGNQIKTVFLLLLGAVGFVLLIACANVANMMLSRALVRSREFAVRAALGASRWRLTRQMLVESVLLSCLGGLFGLGLAAGGVRAFDFATREVDKPYWIQFQMDYRVFAYFAAISVLSGILFGLLPALRTSRVDLNATLKDDTRSGTGHRGGRLAGALVVGQFALTVVLLAGAGMMGRSFLAVRALNPFVPAEHIFTARFQLPEGKGERYENARARLQFHDRLQSLLGTLPGVTEVAAASSLPGLGATTRDIEIEGNPNIDPKHRPHASMIAATPSYFPLIRLPILMGRGFEETDGGAGREAAVVTREFAAKYWPGRAAVGQRFRFFQNDEPGAWMTVVGISSDIVQETQQPDLPPLVYITARQDARGGMALLLRTASDPAALAGPVRAAVQSLDQDLALFEGRTLPAALERRYWFLRVFGTLFAVFAATGLLMAAVGIYAVVAQATAQRTREIGVRVALGATAAGILRLVLARGLRQLVIGLLLGLAGAAGATRLLAASGILVNGISPNDPLVFIGITTLLASIGVFACWLPARRATKLDPMVALRCE